MHLGGRHARAVGYVALELGTNGREHTSDGVHLELVEIVDSKTVSVSVYSQIRRGPPAHHSTVLISSKDGSAPLGQSPNLPPDCLSNPFDCPHKGPPIEGPTICEFVTVCPSVCSAFQM